jgi:hypothetical protein
MALYKYWVVLCFTFLYVSAGSREEKFNQQLSIGANSEPWELIDSSEVSRQPRNNPQDDWELLGGITDAEKDLAPKRGIPEVSHTLKKKQKAKTDMWYQRIPTEHLQNRLSQLPQEIGRAGLLARLGAQNHRDVVKSRYYARFKDQFLKLKQERFVIEAELKAREWNNKHRRQWKSEMGKPLSHLQPPRRHSV